MDKCIVSTYFNTRVHLKEGIKKLGDTKKARHSCLCRRRLTVDAPLLNTSDPEFRGMRTLKEGPSRLSALVRIADPDGASANEAAGCAYKGDSNDDDSDAGENVGSDDADADGDSDRNGGDNDDEEEGRGEEKVENDVSDGVRYEAEATDSVSLQIRLSRNRSALVLLATGFVNAADAEGNRETRFTLCCSDSICGCGCNGDCDWDCR